MFYKNNHLYDLGLNYTKLDDPLEVIQKIKELEKVLRPFFRKLLKIASLVAAKITTEVFFRFLMIIENSFTLIQLQEIFLLTQLLSDRLYLRQVFATSELFSHF